MNKNDIYYALDNAETGIDYALNRLDEKKSSHKILLDTLTTVQAVKYFVKNNLNDKTPNYMSYTFEEMKEMDDRLNDLTEDDKNYFMHLINFKLDSSGYWEQVQSDVEYILNEYFKEERQ